MKRQHTSHAAAESCIALIDARFLAWLQGQTDTRQRAAGAYRADETIHLAVRLFPDFRPRGFDMALAVGHVVEVVGRNQHRDRRQKDGGTDVFVGGRVLDRPPDGGRP